MAKDVKINIVAKDKGSKVVKKFSSTATSALKKLAGPLAIGAVVTGFTKLLNDTVKLGDQFHKLNLKLGVSVETLSKLKQVAKLNGVAFTTVTGSIERMQRRIGLAERGLGAAKKAFEELNIEISEMVNLSAEEQFLRLGEKIVAIENPTRRAALAFETFGMSGAQLLQMLPDLRKNLEKTGASITTQQSKDFAEYADNMAELGHTIEGMKVSVFGKIVKGINAITESIKLSVVPELTDSLESLEKKLEKLRKIPAPSIWDAVSMWAIDPSKIDTAGQIKKLEKLIKLKKMSVGITGEEDRTKGPGISPEQRVKLGGGGFATPDKPISLEGTYYDPEDEKLKRNIETWEKRNQTKFDYDWQLEVAEGEKFTRLIDQQTNYNHVMETAAQDEITREQEKFATLQELYDKDAEAKVAAEKKKFDAQQKNLNATGAALGDLSSTLEKYAGQSDENAKKSFKVRKAVSIAEATVDTYAAASKALKVEPSWLGIIQSGIVIATGLLNVATISKQQPKFAKGGAFTNSMVNQPTQFNMGEMGEAGPEGILPLDKMADGSLGVKSSGGGQQPIYVNLNISAMDTKSFADFTRRNPHAITGPIIQQIQRGNSALNNTIRQVNR